MLYFHGISQNALTKLEPEGSYIEYDSIFLFLKGRKYSNCVVQSWKKMDALEKYFVSDYLEFNSQKIVI